MAQVHQPPEKVKASSLLESMLETLLPGLSPDASDDIAAKLQSRNVEDLLMHFPMESMKDMAEGQAPDASVHLTSTLSRAASDADGFLLGGGKLERLQWEQQQQQNETAAKTLQKVMAMTPPFSNGTAATAASKEQDILVEGKVDQMFASSKVGNDTMDLNQQPPNSLSHLISWSVGTQMGYRNHTIPFPARHPIHPDFEDMHWPTLDDRAFWDSGMGSTDLSGSPSRGGLAGFANQTQRSLSSKQGNVSIDKDQMFMDLLDEKEEVFKELLDDGDDDIASSPIDISQTTKIIVLADGHGGVGAARFFVPRIRVAMHDLMRSRDWNFSIPSHQEEFRTKSHEIFRTVDSEYVADKMASYRRWRNEIVLTTQDYSFDGDHASRKQKMTRPPDDGCTMVVTVLHGNYVVNLNVGDSRTVLASRPGLTPVRKESYDDWEDDFFAKRKEDMLAADTESSGNDRDDAESQDSDSAIGSIKRRSSFQSLTEDAKSATHPMSLSNLLSSSQPSSSSSSSPQSKTFPPNPATTWPSLPLGIGKELEWRIDFASEDHNMTHPAKVWHIHKKGGRFINPDGTPRPLLDPCTPPEKRNHEPYNELKGARINRPPSETVRSYGISHRRTLNLTATLGDVLFKVEPPVMSADPDVTFTRLEEDRDYVLVMATDGVWDHLRSRFLIRLDQEGVEAVTRIVRQYEGLMSMDEDPSSLASAILSEAILSSEAIGNATIESDRVARLREELANLPASVVKAFLANLLGLVKQGMVGDGIVTVEGDDVQNAMVLSVVTAAVDAAVREMMMMVIPPPGGQGSVSAAATSSSPLMFPEDAALEPDIDERDPEQLTRIESPIPRRGAAAKDVIADQMLEDATPNQASPLSNIVDGAPLSSAVDELASVASNTTVARVPEAIIPSPTPSPTPSCSSTSSSVSSSSTAVSPAGPSLTERLALAAISLVQREAPPVQIHRSPSGANWQPFAEASGSSPQIGGGLRTSSLRRHPSHPTLNTSDPALTSLAQLSMKMLESPDVMTPPELHAFNNPPPPPRQDSQPWIGRGNSPPNPGRLFYQGQQRYDDATAFVVSIMSRATGEALRMGGEVGTRGREGRTSAGGVFVKTGQMGGEGGSEMDLDNPDV
ncbi:hypothetical protein HDU97_009235 [Phlyctochytrium planicorne]|nr:hypothetical protein HDU97_009235 [Phlyctochytrium planicorne]